MKAIAVLVIAGGLLATWAVAQTSDTSSRTAAAANTQNSADQDELKIVEGPRIELVTANTAQIAWSTDVESSAIVRYGTDKNKLDQTAMQEWGGQKTAHSAVHRVTIKNLKPNTTYYFQVESGEGWHQAKGTAKSDVHTLTTKGEGAPSAPAPATSQTVQPETAAVSESIQPGNIMAGPLAADVTHNTATVWWMSTDARGGALRYGKDPNNLDQKVSVPAGDVKKIPLANLQPDTTYFFDVLDAMDKKIHGGAFKTENADFAKAKFKIVQGPVIQMVGKDTAIIAWSTSARSSSVVRYGTRNDQLDQTAMAPWGQQLHRVIIRNLKPDTRYYFQVESSQAEGTGLSAKSNIAPFHTMAEGQAAMKNPNWR